MEKRGLSKKIFDPVYAKEISKDYDLKVNLKKNYKGVSLFAKKLIKKGNVIAYYKFLLHDSKRYTGHKNNMYTMSVYNKNNKENSKLIGDIYNGSLEKPKYGIPFWAYFSNEPAKNQKENSYIDINLKGNFRKRDKVKAGDSMVYKLIAAREIKPGEEIVWCYGDAYNRDYPTTCEN